MTEYKKLYNQIDKLNNKIKKLELSVDGKKQTIKTNSSKLNNNIQNNNFKTSLVSYRINFPKESYSNKKYIALKFDDNPNEYDSDIKSGSQNLTSFIKLFKSNVIINYTLQLELDCTPIDSIICSVGIGIRTMIDSKIRIIKGTKNLFDLVSNKIDNKIIISNTILYSAEDGEELCMIVDFDFVSGSNCVVNSKKSIIKLLFV